MKLPVRATYCTLEAVLKPSFFFWQRITQGVPGAFPAKRCSLISPASSSRPSRPSLEAV